MVFGQILLKDSLELKRNKPSLGGKDPCMSNPWRGDSTVSAFNKGYMSQLYVNTVAGKIIPSY